MWHVTSATFWKTPSRSSSSLLVVPRLMKLMPAARQSRSSRAAVEAASAALAAAESARVMSRTVCTS